MAVVTGEAQGVDMSVMRLKAVLVKLIYQYNVDPVSLLMLRLGFALPFYLVILHIDHKRTVDFEKPSRLNYIQLILFGILGYYLASYFDFLGLQFIKAGLERIILFSYPTIVILLSWIFLKRKASLKQIVAIIITYLGIYICFQGESDFSGSREEILKGCFFVFCGAICFAAYVVGTEYLIPKFGTIKFTGYAMLIATITITIHYSIVKDASVLDLHPNVYLLSLLMATVCTVIPSFLVSHSIKIISANNFGVIASLGPISTIIMAFFILGETLEPIQLGGALIVISGILVISKK